MHRFARLIGHHAFQNDEPGNGGTPPAVVPTPPTPTVEPAQPSKQEWADFHRTQREQANALKTIVERLTAPVAPSPDDKRSKPNDQEAGLAAQLAERDKIDKFRDAIEDAGVGGERRKALRLMWDGSGKPTENIADWVAQHVKLIGGGSSPAVPAPLAPALVAPQVPAPVVPGLSEPTWKTGHPDTWPDAERSKMNYDEYEKAKEEWQMRSIAAGDGRVSVHQYQKAAIARGRSARNDAKTK